MLMMAINCYSDEILLEETIKLFHPPVENISFKKCMLHIFIAHAKNIKFIISNLLNNIKYF